MAANAFRLGFAFPTTTADGEVDVSIGVPMVKLTNLVIQKINSDPYILPNVDIHATFTALYHDTRYDISEAIEAALHYCYDLDNVVGLIGDTSSSRSIYIAQVAAIFKVPLISFVSTSPLLSDKDRFPTFLRTCPPDTLQGTCLADLVNYYGWKTVNTFSTDDDYGSKCIEAFQDRAHELDIELGMHKSFNELEDDPEVFARITDQLKSTNVRVTVGCSQLQPLVKFLNASDGAGLFEVGYSWLTSETAFWVTKDADPVIGKANLLGSSLLYNDKNDDSELWRNLMSDWDPNDGRVPGGPYIVDAIYMYAAALHSAMGSDPPVDPLEDRDGFLDILFNTKLIGGATGDLVLDAFGDRLGGYDIINTRLKEGVVELTTVGAWTPPPADGSPGGGVRMDPSATVLFAGDSPVVPIGVVEDSPPFSPAGSSSSSFQHTGYILIGIAMAVVLLCGVFYRHYRHMSSKVTSLNRMVAFTAEQEALVRRTMEDVNAQQQQQQGDEGVPLTSVRLKFDDIVLGGKLGVGSFGDVWAGELRGVECAVKYMLPDRVTRENMLMFRREIDLLRRMSHPNVIRFMGACWDPPNVLLVLELAEGSVHDRITNPELPRMKWREGGLRIAMDVARGMGYMHSLSPPVLHRDIKSHNVLLSREGQAKLTDFGSSREITDSTMTQIGSHFWLPPEVFLGKRYDEKCDVYSYAIFLCELAVEGGAVQSVFDGVRLAAIPMHLVNGWRPALGGDRFHLPLPGLPHLVQRCWQEDASLRPSFSEVYEILGAIAEDRWVKMPVPPPAHLREGSAALEAQLADTEGALVAALGRVVELEEQVALLAPPRVVTTGSAGTMGF